MSSQTLDLRAALSQVPKLFLVTDGDPKHTARGKLLLRGLLAVALAGLVSGIIAFLYGHHVMGTNSEIPWGVLIASYTFFVANTSGLCLVGSLGHVFGYKLFEPVAKKALLLALINLLLGFAVIGSELERPLLLLKMVLLSPNPTSPIWWMGTLYGLYLFVILFELYFLLREDHRRAKVAGIVGVIAAVAAHTNLGAVFGLSHARAFWAGPFFPIFFLAWALACGAALLALMVYFQDYFSRADKQVREEHKPLLAALGQLLALFLSIVAVLAAWKLISDVYADHRGLAVIGWARMTGPLFFSVWIFEIFLGLVIPLALLLGPKRNQPRTIAMAAALPMLGVFVMRYNFVYAGQMLSLKPIVGHLGEVITYGPPFKGNPAGFLSYTPSIVEALIVAGAVAGVILLYVAGTKLLEPAKEA